jgi:hypothetical protein
MHGHLLEGNLDNIVPLFLAGELFALQINDPSRATMRMHYFIAY